ncbi:NnrS family protein [Roseateles sp. BYS96W]|uniref:NnrS family protein n=1 Tax=Pelomonas nitida TaxID=3299027 RepID=A0ABW7GCR5_9BURK
MALIRLEESPRAPRSGFALFALGFRPFYLLASVFAALSVPLWALQFSGLLGHAYLAGPLWHAHEMLFGFTLAVIVGFLFTAGHNWTQLPTPSGWLLAALALLWVAGRVLVLTPFAVAAAVVNVVFPLAAAGALAVPFIRARNQRNYFFIGLLLLLAVAAGAIHLGQLGLVDATVLPGTQLALDVVLFILVVMGGRVIPMFTNNGVPGTQAARRPHLEKLALGSVLALGAVDLMGLSGWPAAAVAVLAGLAHAGRLALWQPWRTRRVPLVWVLHAAYAWIPVHLLLRAGAELGWVMPSLAVHALAVGAVGGLVIGMMTRTARGHTGRPLRADRYEVACYVAVLLAALVRVGLPLLNPAWTVPAVQASATLWSLGFGLYAVRYWPVLSRPRLDGRPG